MVLSTVGVVLGKLSDVALKKALELYGVGDHIEPMKMEFNLMKGFLKDADSKCNKNPQVKAWVNELGDLAYRIEDVLDTFLVDIEENKPTSSSVMGKLKRAVKNPMKVNDLCDKIKQITKLLDKLYKRAIEMGIKDIKEENHPIPTQFRPADPSHFGDSDVVGLVTEKDKIISHLLDRTISRRTVLSIVGPGGLGKTTLAHQVYKSLQFKNEFDCVTWLSISQKWDEKSLRRQILYSIVPAMKKKDPPVTDEDVLKELKSSLAGKRYLIILDDVWKVNLWEQLRPALPDPNNASRVLITTRNHAVATAADRKTQPIKPNYLDDDESLALLFRKALQQPIQRNEYPLDLKNIGKRLMKKCKGLPLALIVLGGILSRRDCNSTAWQEVEDTLDWHNDVLEGKECSQILALSYEDLPYELKPCFLYFASFPEDYEISANHITKMWVAEGFIPKDGVGTMEDRAKKWLAELVGRCLVNVNKISSSGRCKTCKMHDLLLDLAIHEAKSSHFLTVFRKAAENSSHVNSTLMRRATLHFCTSIECNLLSSKTRSLICFGDQKLNYQGFKLLRVLNIDSNNKPLEAIRISGDHWFKCLIYLRFLGFRNCYQVMLDGLSFSYFKNFETLDVTNTYTNWVHKSLWQVPTLRNIIASKYQPISNTSSQWDNLKNIQTIKWLNISGEPKLTDNINLLKLGVFLTRTTQYTNVWEHLRSLLKWTPSLTALSILLHSDQRIKFWPNYITADLPCPEKLQKLYLEGPWAVALRVEMLPTNLVKCTLLRSRLKEDPMPVLERLPSLAILKLLTDSYTGPKLICSVEGFPSLEKLILRGLQNLSEWEIKKGAMPCLNHLEVNKCDKLHKLPELQDVPRLQKKVVDGHSVQLDRRMQSED